MNLRTGVKRASTTVAVLALVGVSGLLLGCSSLGDLTRGIQKPEARVIRSEIEALSFDAVALRFDVEITNPNPIGVQLAGFDYELDVEGETLLSGTVDRRVGVAPRGRSVVPVPVQLRFESLFATAGKVAHQDEFAYRLTTGFSFDLPLLGKVRIPVSAAGTLPVLRTPRLRVQRLQVTRLSPAGASLVLGLEVENRNGFGVALEGLEYSFTANGERWAAGSAAHSLAVAPHGRGWLDLEFQISFSAVGRSAYQLLAAGGPLRYDLRANLDLGTTLALLPRVDLPLQTEGQIRAIR